MGNGILVLMMITKPNHLPYMYKWASDINIGLSSNDVLIHWWLCWINWPSTFTTKLQAGSQKMDRSLDNTEVPRAKGSLPLRTSHHQPWPLLSRQEPSSSSCRSFNNNNNHHLMPLPPTFHHHQTFSLWSLFFRICMSVSNVVFVRGLVVIIA